MISFVFRGGQFPRHIPLSVSFHWFGGFPSIFSFFSHFPFTSLRTLFLSFCLFGWVRAPGGLRVSFDILWNSSFCWCCIFASASSWSQVNNGGRFWYTPVSHLVQRREWGMDWTDSAPGATPNNLQQLLAGPCGGTSLSPCFISYGTLTDLLMAFFFFSPFPFTNCYIPRHLGRGSFLQFLSSRIPCSTIQFAF